MTYKHSCKACGVTDGCKRAFARYWHDKSHGGEGCNCVFPQVAPAADRPAPAAAPKKTPRKFNMPRQEELV